MLLIMPKEISITIKMRKIQKCNHWSGLKPFKEPLATSDSGQNITLQKKIKCKK